MNQRVKRAVQTASVACRSLCDPSEHLPLLGKQSLHPIDHCAHAGGAAQIAVNDDPVFGRDFGDRWGQPLEQNFVAHQPDQVWLADITYIPTSQGWIYLAVILDLFTRKVVGWAMREHMRAELTIAALIMAIQRRRPGAGLIHHSDRGSQNAASEYRDILQAAAITQSMSRKANCWDNAPMESFFGTLKTELVHHREYPDRATARRELFAYIEGYYNRARIHSAIGYITPQQAEAKAA
jgi:transposase InsO family protein